MRIIVGMGVYYNALRVVQGRVVVVQCKGDDDRIEDRHEAKDEEEAVRDFFNSKKRR
jgi:hypothetical protein